MELVQNSSHLGVAYPLIHFTNSNSCPQGARNVVDLRISCRPQSRLHDLGICDGSLRLVDMPGQDETDNPVVKELRELATGACRTLGA